MTTNQTSVPAEIRIPASRKPPLWAWLVGTFFGVGTLHPGPGTWGSLTIVILWWTLAHSLPRSVQWPLCILLAGFATLIGIPAATQVARALGRKDPQIVVIDEVAGQLIALIGTPLAVGSPYTVRAFLPLFCGFILFRAFDMTKPPPVRALESLPGGTGIVVDDIGAGIYALIVMQLLLWFRILG